MRFAISLGWCGYLLDFSLGPAEDDELVDDEPETFRGDALSTPVGFVRPHIPWDADGPVHQFDPDEASEDY